MKRGDSDTSNNSDSSFDAEETTVFCPQPSEESINARIPLSRLLEKHSIDTNIDLQDAHPEGSKSLLPSRDRDGGRYETVEQLAKGGMGIVLRCIDKDLRRQIAMKVIAPEKNQYRETMVRFVEEAQITGQLEHPNIIPVHEMGVDGRENLFYTMKLIKGHTLKEILDGLREGRSEIVEKYGLSQLLNVFLKVCDGVAFAHSKGVVHRDLKPQNIMIGDFGEVIVLDWGIAKILPPDHQEKRKNKARGRGDRAMSSLHKALANRRAMLRRRKVSSRAGQSDVVDSIRTSGDKDTDKTHDGQIMGSPGFMAPEQVHGELDEIDQQTDVYSLGAILYNILSLSHHVEGDSVQDILEAMISGRSESPTEMIRRKTRDGVEIKLPHCPDGKIPTALSMITMKALEIDKCNRYEEVRQLQKDILAYQGDYTTTAESVNRFRECLLFLRRNKVISIALVAAFLLLAFTIYPLERANYDLDSRLVAAEQRVEDLSDERVDLLDELGEIRRPGYRAEQAAKDLARLMHGWHWEKANQQAHDLMLNLDRSTLLLPPKQLMCMAQLRLFHGDIDGALPLLQLLQGSEMSKVSKALIGALTTNEQKPIPLPDSTAGAMDLYKKLRKHDHPEAKLAADCLMAGIVRTLVEAKLPDDAGQREEAFDLGIEWMRHSSRHSKVIEISRGEGNRVTISQSEEVPIRLEILRWLPVEHLDLGNCPGLDLAGLGEMSGLKTLRVARTAKSLDQLRQLELERIGFDELLPPAEFWSLLATDEEDR